MMTQDDQEPGEPPLYPPANAVETTYRGCRFRSRLEARWAVFWDYMKIPWRYETEGFDIDGRWYLPDFLLTDCATWVEVKGPEDGLDKPFLLEAALRLPRPPVVDEHGPRLMILGHHPRTYTPIVDPRAGDWGWLGLYPDGRGDELIAATHGFGRYHRHRRPWLWEERSLDEPWLQAIFDPTEVDNQDAYTAANSARFEHGEKGWLRP